jgi:hypothetical protein
MNYQANFYYQTLTNRKKKKNVKFSKVQLNIFYNLEMALRSPNHFRFFHITFLKRTLTINFLCNL